MYDPEATPAGFPPQHEAGYAHVGAVSLFDYVVGNSDRSPNKNNFVAGGCASRRCAHARRTGTAATPDHPGPPEPVYLDHGLVFSHPDTSPLYNLTAGGGGGRGRCGYCRFYAPLAATLRARHARGGVAAALLAVMPEEVVAAMEPRRVRAADTRLAAVVEHMGRCVKRWGVETAFFT